MTNTPATDLAGPPEAHSRRSDPRVAAVCALALIRKRRDLALGLMENLAGWEKYADQIAAEREGDRFLDRELFVFVDYLARYFSTGNDAFKHLYIGEKLKQLYIGPEDPEQRRIRATAILDADNRVFLGVLKDEINAAASTALESLLAEIRRVVLGEAKKTLQVLLVGDCLHLDIQAFLAAQCIEDGIAINPVFATSKNGPVLRNEIRKLANHRFDIIFHSPFSYEFSPAVASFNRWQRALDGRRRIEAVINEAMADTNATIELLAKQFDCPVMVHNTLLTRRHDGTPRERLKNLLSRRARLIARGIVNRQIAESIARANDATFEHVFPLDELSLLESHALDDLGLMIYNSDLQHPAVLGSVLAGKYREIIAARVGLVGRKLVVCDLDNTLWAGEIGEGAVTHFPDRQRTLLKLKQKGVVLAVNSKNDPKNVKWNGALLGEHDFVNQQINWDSKVTNMKRIREALNLKYQDYVFIDDRADQLEQVGSAFPEMRVLDATDERSWTLLDTWAGLIPHPTDGDRTQFYRDREARENFLADVTTEDQGAVFAKLGIRVTIREAAVPELQRVTELINRTNQFNLAGSRTTFEEITKWHADRNHILLVAEASDKFGKMGLICVAVLRHDGSAIQIPIFVLSCRVFGYGIETAVLNVVKRLAGAAAGDGTPLIVGAYAETAHNAPCRSMYPDHGFKFDGSVWTYQTDEQFSDPSWLTIDNRISTPELGALCRTM